ncbi:MAG TPA: M23 family metallopeptidase [Microlunatus sp.]
MITPVAPDPIPVPGTDGRYHVVYELLVLNASARVATITKVETLADHAGGAVVGAIEGAQVVALSLIVGDYRLPPLPATSVPVGRSVLVLMDDSYAEREAIPSQVVHRVEASFGPLGSEQADYAKNFPDRSVQIGGAVTVSDGLPTVIGPPLTGDSWVAVNACCTLSPHRGAMIPIAGRINGSERYAVDWSRFDLKAEPLIDVEKGIDARLRGDPTRNESYFTFGQPVVAVADATVVTVVSDLPEAPPGTLLPGLSISDVGGNRIILELGNGVFAFYAHLQTGSPTVRAGDPVRKGQLIARAGNSGNTSESHLHFHLMDSPLPLTAENVPFVIDSFTFDGTASAEKLLTEPPPGPRTSELPMINSAVSFPTTGG